MNRILVCVAFAACGASALAQSMAPATDPGQKQSPSAEPPPTLRGPDVPREVKTTLVQRDARGNLRRVEGRPEDAALALLDLEPDVRERAKSVASDRAVRLGTRMIEDIERVRVISDATQAGDRERAADLVREFWHEFEAGEPREPLLAEIAGMLTTEQAASLRRLTDEYWNAWIDWELRNSKDTSERARERVRTRLAFQLFQDEVRQAYERIIKPYRDRIEGLYGALDPTPEQREAIRDVVIAYVKESKAKPTPEQRRAVLGKIYRLLDEERRAKFFDLVARDVSNP
ncbi:MAG: hypothetical protein SFY69_10900 [Planctomycetota bacterium]|nr:hypothetical protein [Planctomycetota bacterium]